MSNIIFFEYRTTLQEGWTENEGLVISPVINESKFYIEVYEKLKKEGYALVKDSFTLRMADKVIIASGSAKPFNKGANTKVPPSTTPQTHSATPYDLKALFGK